jgi:hypothetical protein
MYKPWMMLVSSPLFFPGKIYVIDSSPLPLFLPIIRICLAEIYLLFALNKNQTSRQVRVTVLISM